MGLKIKVLKAPTKTGDCGGANSQVKWILDAGDTGWVIQQVDWDHDVLKCDDTPDAELNGARDCLKRDLPRFWEAWRVEKGKVFIGRSANAHNADTYSVIDHPTRKKKHSITGKVQFIAGYNLTVGDGADDWKENDIPVAGALPTRKTKPTGFDATSARDHNLEAEWNCCQAKPQRPTITGDPTTSDPGSGERVKYMIPLIVSPAARRVANHLFSSLSWLDFNGDKKVQAKIASRLRQISAYHDDIIRGGMEFFIDQLRRKKAYSLDQQSKLFLLNRYLFRLPRYVLRGEFPLFGGWVLPDFDERFNPNWPFTLQKGAPVLKDSFGGFMGDDFLALDEFDYFRYHYPRRKAVSR